MEKLEANSKCLKCDRDIETDWKVCPYCADQLKKPCPNPECGKETIQGWIACAYCGTTLYADIDHEEIETIEKELSESPAINKCNIEFIRIPATTFLTSERRPDGKNFLGNTEYKYFTHEISITKAYWISQYPITNKIYHKLIGEVPNFHNKDLEKDGDMPVLANWFEAKEFCEKLQLNLSSTLKKHGYEIRLPTEAEWECSARDGLRGYIGMAGEMLKGLSKDQPPLPIVKYYSEENVKIPHMLGNTGEWCLDWHEFYSKEKMINPKGPKNGKHRAVRGGCSKCEKNGFYLPNSPTYRDAAMTPESNLFYPSFRPVFAPAEETLEFTD